MSNCKPSEVSDNLLIHSQISTAALYPTLYNGRMEFSNMVLNIVTRNIPGTIPSLGSANERRRYVVTSSLIGWAHTQNDFWYTHLNLSSMVPRYQVTHDCSPVILLIMYIIILYATYGIISLYYMIYIIYQKYMCNMYNLIFGTPFTVELAWCCWWFSPIWHQDICNC